IADAFGPGTRFEVYDGSSGARYLTVTGNVTNAPAPIATASDADLAPLVDLLPRKSPPPRPSDHGHDDPGHDLDRARWGLLHEHLLGPDAGGYDPWFRVGVALRCLGDAGLDLWRQWSSSSQHWNEREILQKWPGMHGSSIGSLFGMFDDADASWR